jgi:neuromedin U receptor 1
VCVTETAPWVEEYVGENLYYSLYFLFRVAFVHLIPCFALAMFNYSLIMSMRQAQQKRKKLFDNSCNKLKKNDKNCTTLMLIVVLTAFLIVEIPLAIITSAHVFSSLFYNFLDYRLANLGILFTNFFLIISYPINFTIYCGMSRQFRITFVSLFCNSMNVNSNEVTIFRHEPSRNSRYSIVNGPRTTCHTTESVL